MQGTQHDHPGAGCDQNARTRSLSFWTPNSDGFQQRGTDLATNPAGKVLHFSQGHNSVEWLLADAFEHAPNGMALLDRDGTIHHASSAFCDILGYRMSELAGPMDGHEPIMPTSLRHYDLHVWLWKDNPRGMFTSTNAALKCTPGAAYTIAIGATHHH